MQAGTAGGASLLLLVPRGSSRPQSQSADVQGHGAMLVAD